MNLHISISLYIAISPYLYIFICISSFFSLHIRVSSHLQRTTQPKRPSHKDTRRPRRASGPRTENQQSTDPGPRSAIHGPKGTERTEDRNHQSTDRGPRSAIGGPKDLNSSRARPSGAIGPVSRVAGNPKMEVKWCQEFNFFWSFSR